jgi:AcrR family transcriptional regulator
MAAPRRPERAAARSASGGRPRDPGLDEAIAETARAVLAERGLADLTLEEIARRAGVSRATVYRRWPNLDALLVHLLRGLVHEFRVPPHDDVRDALIALLAEQADVLVREAGSLYPILGAHAAFDPAAREALTEIVKHRRAPLEVVLRRGIESRQLPADVDIDLSLYLLWGPVYYRYLGALGGQGPIERDFIVRVVDSLLAGLQHGDRSTAST